MMNAVKSFFRTGVLLALCVGLLVRSASAAASSQEIKASLRVYPVKIELPVAPGGSRSVLINVENTGSLPARILVYACDFTRDEEGNYTFFDPGERELARSAAGWLTLPVREFELAPARSGKVEITLTAPENAEPGGHYAMVFVEAEPLLTGQSAPEGPYILGKARVGALLLSTVEGEIDRRGEIASFKAPRFNLRRRVPLDLSFENTGNVHIDLIGIITIRTRQGHITKAIHLAERTSLPASGLKITEVWEAPPLPGYFSASITVVSREGEEWETTLSFWVVPLKEMASLLALALLITGGWFLFARKFRFRLERRAGS